MCAAWSCLQTVISLYNPVLCDDKRSILNLKPIKSDKKLTRCRPSWRYQGYITLGVDTGHKTLCWQTGQWCLKDNGRPVRNAASETLNATWLMRLGVRFDSSFVPRPSHKTKSLDGLFAISPALPSCPGFLLCTQQVSRVFHPSHVSTKCRVEWWTTLSNPVAFTNT